MPAKTKPPFKHFWVHSIEIACVLIVLYGAYALLSNIRNTVPTPAAAASSISCGLPNNSFCGTDQQFKNLVKTLDFSDILEKQPPTTVTCSSAAQLKPFCQGVQNGLVLQLFQVYQGQNPQLLTRNQYISFFKSYFAAHGPLNFTGDIASGSSMTMHFANENQSAQYILTFEHISTTWGLTSVTVTAP